MFRWAMGVIFEMILAECGRSSAADQKEASAHMHKTIASQAATSAYFITGSDKRQLGHLRDDLGGVRTFQRGAHRPPKHSWTGLRRHAEEE